MEGKSRWRGGRQLFLQWIFVCGICLVLAFLWGNIPHGATEQLSPYLTSVLTPERAARREKQRESLFKEVGESLAGSSKAGKRDAYVTLVANDEFLLPGMVLGYSLRDFLSGPEKPDLVCVATSQLSAQGKSKLEQVGWKVLVMDLLENPFANTYTDGFIPLSSSANHLTQMRIKTIFTKLQILTLTQYNRLMYVDSDTMFIRQPGTTGFDCLGAGNAGGSDPYSSRDLDVRWVCMKEQYRNLYLTSEPAWNINAGVMAIRPSLKVFNDMMNSTSLKTNHWAGDQGYQQNYWFFGCREGPVVSHLNLTKEHLKYPLHEDLSEEDSTVDTTPYFLNVSTWTGSYFVPRMEIPTLSDLPWPHPYGPKEFMTESEIKEKEVRVLNTDKCAYLSPVWNHQPGEENPEPPILVHFTGPNLKPWDWRTQIGGEEYFVLWYSYAKILDPNFDFGFFLSSLLSLCPVFAFIIYLALVGTSQSLSNWIKSASILDRFPDFVVVVSGTGGLRVLWLCGWVIAEGAMWQFIYGSWFLQFDPVCGWLGVYMWSCLLVFPLLCWLSFCGVGGAVGGRWEWLVGACGVGLVVPVVSSIFKMLILVSYLSL